MELAGGGACAFPVYGGAPGKDLSGALVTLHKLKSLYSAIRAVLRETAEVVRIAVTDGHTPYMDRVYTIMITVGNLPTTKSWPVPLRNAATSRILMPLGNVG